MDESRTIADLQAKLDRLRLMKSRVSDSDSLTAYQQATEKVKHETDAALLKAETKAELRLSIKVSHSKPVRCRSPGLTSVDVQEGCESF